MGRATLVLGTVGSEVTAGLGYGISLFGAHTEALGAVEVYLPALTHSTHSGTHLLYATTEPLTFGIFHAHLSQDAMHIVVDERRAVTTHR